MFGKESHDMHFIIKKNIDFSRATENVSIKVVIMTENLYLLKGMNHLIFETISCRHLFEVTHCYNLSVLLEMDFDFLIIDGALRSAFLLLITPASSINYLFRHVSRPHRVTHILDAFFSEGAKQQSLSGKYGCFNLTPREVEIRDYLSASKSLIEIARLTNMSNKRVSYFKQKLKKKTHCISDVELFNALNMIRNIQFHC
ncbi:helix-turn-helix transcriptional regulator [Cedecea sp.]|jgi:DNA-binding CsgD family transcriptional regulator|uniref:helix-turn-helix transcriptional regulator n=1 Tax=Cedecea sp. TaxID=1970739 RepID=UPI0039C85EDC